MTGLPAPWRDDWENMPTEGWVWIADTDGEVTGRLAGGVKRLVDSYRATPWATFRYIAWADNRPPQHPVDLDYDFRDWYDTSGGSGGEER